MTQEIIRARAQMLRRTREFFFNEGYIEVDTPTLVPEVIPEAHIDLFETFYDDPYDEDRRTKLYLIPSPEVSLKPLIGKMGGRIFQLGHCFRNRESIGSHHNPEFTMLEYYESGVDEHDLLRRTAAYLRYLLRDPNLGALARNAGRLEVLAREPVVLTVEEAFARFVGIELFQGADGGGNAEAFAERCRSRGLSPSEDADWPELFSYVMASSLEPALPRDAPVFLTDYPAGCDVLARRGGDGRTRRRWELYLCGLEIANCFMEESDPENVRRFVDRQIEERRRRGASEVRSAEPIVHALDGASAVAGAALGFDRLLMCLSGVSSVEGVIFSPLHDSLKRR